MRRANPHIFAFLLLFTISLFVDTAVAQSGSQEFPTPVTSSEISGTIRPRDVGDARLTSYYYQFDGSQGDLFINVVTRNFTGDIDVFIQNGLRPLTKIVVYADLAEQETGRVLYLRKPEKMILRVQGRPPGDDPATFRIKFAGSFVASTQSEPVGEPALPTLTARNESGIRVNSVGTIIEVIPKATPAPTPAEPVAEKSEAAVKAEVEKAETSAPEVSVADKPKETETGETGDKKVEVVVSDTLPKSTGTTRRTTGRRGRASARTKTTDPPKTSAETVPESGTPPRSAPPTGRRRRGQPPASNEAKEPDPLEKVNLVILFKDGTTIARPMSEVLRFTVDKGVLTVVAKDGSIGRYSILDVGKVTIE